ncbi:hypothetical protein [Streptomyces sp. NPDC058394]|uniref:hypothetical protein n=1 Tax=Streptomyces sp. NPDC058394 TaxID=3346477 RepID=UPI003656CAD1
MVLLSDGSRIDVIQRMPLLANRTPILGFVHQSRHYDHAEYRRLVWAQKSNRPSPDATAPVAPDSAAHSGDNAMAPWTLLPGSPATPSPTVM